MPTTIRDVAVAARVSPATVSRVLNGKEDVGADLRRRVLGVVAELGYRRNGPARRLRTRAAMVLGLIISDVTNPFFTAVVRGAEDQAQRAGYSVVLANADEDVAKEARYLEVAAAEQMAGVLLSPASPRQTSIDVLLEQGVPVVTIDRRLAAATVDSVMVNNRQAARDAAQHLIGQGCRRVGIVAGPVQTTTGAGRLATTGRHCGPLGARLIPRSLPTLTSGPRAAIQPPGSCSGSVCRRTAFSSPTTS